jgi:hypothetical protein
MGFVWLRDRDLRIKTTIQFVVPILIRTPNLSGCMSSHWHITQRVRQMMVLVPLMELQVLTHCMAIQFIYTMWVPHSIAKLVNMTPITMVYDTYNELVTGAYKATYNFGAPHYVCMYIYIISLSQGFMLTDNVKPVTHKPLICLVGSKPSSIKVPTHNLGGLLVPHKVC